MAGASTSNLDYDAMVSAWKHQAPWYRIVSARLGLQGKLILCFFALMSLGLGLSCWLFATQSAARLADVMGEQARQLSATLALSSEEPVRDRKYAELSRVAQDLIKSRNILFVAFLDAESKPVVLASRDLDFRLVDLQMTQQRTESLLQVRQRSSSVFGDYLEVVAPILSSPEPSANLGRSAGILVSPAAEDGSDGESGWSADASVGAPETPAETDAAPAPRTGRVSPAGGGEESHRRGPRMLGYVAVGVSQAGETAQLRQINYVVVGIGCAIVMMAMPLGYLLVHRVFQPIRQLVDATHKIIAGDLDAQVAIHRPDVIGMLARSFNEMVIWVRKQQEDLAAANDKLHEANRDLEQKIEQRTAQLETANRRLSTEIAEKEEFLRAVSHDLNAPLRNISGMATMLMMKYREKLDEDVIHRLERIQKNVEVETDLIGELLELSRIKTRRQKMEPVELGPLVAELRDLFENDLRSKGIELKIDTVLPVLNCERARIRQVFQNLIDNAIKYMGEKGPGKAREIHVGCQIRLTEAEFYVRDTGIGIDPEDVDKVFFVFRRGKNSATQNIAGKGVGLASVKSIVETYNGRIWAESALGQGSTFRFTINGRHVPAAMAASSEAAGALAAVAEQAGAEPAAVEQAVAGGETSEATEQGSGINEPDA